MTVFAYLTELSKTQPKGDLIIPRHMFDAYKNSLKSVERLYQEVNPFADDPYAIRENPGVEQLRFKTRVVRPDGPPNYEPNQTPIV